MLIDGRSPGALRFAKERIVNALVLMNIAPTLLISQLLPGLTNRYFMQSASIVSSFHQSARCSEDARKGDYCLC
jgi:hypothetical protein